MALRLDATRLSSLMAHKRKEILDACSENEEYQRTDELIRPILRGRDVKRYGYNFADLWLIATFPSKHYDIDDYPAVKKYLLSFGN
jgi:adenine-specific DNA-methyltransferase